MSLTELPDVALIKIFRTLNHFELIRLYQTCYSFQHIQNLIQNSSCLWTNIHIINTVDYHLFSCFIRLILHNTHVIRSLIIDELDLTCRKLLNDNEFSFGQFSILEELVIHDEHLCSTAKSIRHCSSSLRVLHLTREHVHEFNLSHLSQLTSLQMTLYSANVLRTQFEQLTNLHLKIMFEHGNNARDIFPLLPTEQLRSFTLHFLLFNSDTYFHNEFHRYLLKCHNLHRIELHYLHGMCPITIHTNINLSNLNRLVLINICELTEMKSFIILNELNLPIEYLQLNTSRINHYPNSSSIQIEYWNKNEIISLDYIQCLTTSMELFQEYNINNWSDKLFISQSFESYILRSIYKNLKIISSLRTLIIDRIEMSLNGLVTILINLNQLIELTITDGKIDQMGSGMCDVVKLIQTTTNSSSLSNLQTLVMSNVQMSRRTVVKLCLITRQLISLTMNDVRLLNKNQNHSNILLLLQQIARLTNQFQWTELKSLTLGKNMINRNNLFSFIGLKTNAIFAPYINHLRIVIIDHSLLEPRDEFLKSIKYLVRCHSKLTSFIVEFTKRYETHVRLRNELFSILEMCSIGKVIVYSTVVHDRACRYCFDNNNELNDEEYSSQKNRLNFCGIPLFQLSKKQRNSIFFCS